MAKHTSGLRLAAVVAGAALVLAACGGSTGDGGAASGEGQKGGTLTFLSIAEQIQHLDPQRNYTGEDLAFASAFLHRTLTQYTYSDDAAAATELTADLATDLGTMEEGGKIWKFTLRDDATWEDGQPVTCEDVKYGVSRTFAQDVITDGPTFAISLLDVSENYKGPYDTSAENDVASYDSAVSCDGNTISFRLKEPKVDFNYTVTLLAFSPVRQDADTGEAYTDRPLSNGPYKIESYEKGKQLVLVRNENWNPDSDPIRPAYPDQIVYQFGLDAAVIDQRLIADAGDDQFALGFGVEPGSLATVFADDPRFNDRRYSEFDPYARYWALNTQKLPNLKHRQAIAAAFPRATLLTIAGGEFAGVLSDGVISPQLGLDYSETGMWTGLLGKEIADDGDIEYAKQLIAESGEPMPEVLIDYASSPTNDKVVGAIVTKLAEAGITVKPNPLEAGAYYGIVFDDAKANHIISAGWGADWPNASTVIPELFGAQGGFNMSRYNTSGVQDPEFQQAIDDARAMSDRAAQAEAWKELNTRSMELALAIPTRFGKEQRIWGSKVGGVYQWAPYGSYPYAMLFVKQ